MKQIFLNKLKLNLDFNPQTSPSGRPIRLSGIGKNLQVSEKYINKGYKNHWIYTFRYLDEQDGFVSFEFDFNDKFLHKL
jgi:hypothetical protein